jgi:putative transposase
MTALGERKKLLYDIQIAVNDGARKNAACKIVGLTVRTIQRWNNDDIGDLRPTVPKTSPKALSTEEKKHILQVCNSQEYCDKNPNEIVPDLAGKGIYIASESTFYKVLKEHKLLTHRADYKPKKAPAEPEKLIATGPNQVLSWDITYLRTAVKGLFFYLYLFMDVWSRKIVGWTVEEIESGEIASQVIERICIENSLEDIYLHSDNGGPMKCGTMLATLEWLGVTPSYSRPRVSNDNPFSESLFKTMKYRPSYPKKFETIEQAIEWVKIFVSWYNTEHLHSGIKYVTPEQRHAGKDIEILKKRHETYLTARKNNPIRWPNSIRNWTQIAEVTLNKRVQKIKIKKIA